MRKLGVCVALSLGALASAQLNSVEEQNLDAAFAYFTDPVVGAYAGMKLQMDGTQQIGESIETFSTTVYWFNGIQDGRPMALISAYGFGNGQPLFQIVGNGTTLWAHDIRRNEYMASRYGNYEGAQPETYTATLFKTLQSLIKGRSSPGVRFLNEVFGWEMRPSQFYRSWMPGVRPVDDGTTFRYQLGDPVRRRLSFDYSLVGGGKRLLTRINYFDQTNLGNDYRLVDWKIDITPLNTVPEGVTFAYTPPIGARPISGIRPVTGG